MRREGNLMNLVLSYENLLMAAIKAMRGKRDKPEVMKFSENICENVREMKKEIERGGFKIGNYYIFKIYDPKERMICAASFKERILHHAIMNITHDFFERKMIYDSYATRIGKGTHKAILRLKSFMSGYTYYVKLDMRKYFDSIDHRVLQDILEKIFKDRDLLIMYKKIVDSYVTSENKGLPIGNLTSQYFANIYLTGLDHYMKENQKVKCYVRYMDDVVMLGRSMDEVKQYANCYMHYASEILKLSCKQPIYGRIRDGINFLGYKVYANYISLSTKSKKRFKRNLSERATAYENGEISDKEYQNSLNSLLGYVKFAKSYNFRKKNIREKVRIDN